MNEQNEVAVAIPEDVQKALSFVAVSTDLDVRNLRGLVLANMVPGEDCFDLVGLARVLAKYKKAKKV